MYTRKQIKKKIKEIIDDECVIDKDEIKGSDDLEDDLELDNDDFKSIRDAINDEFDLEIKKKHLKGCIDVNDVVDLVQSHIIKEMEFEEQKAIAFKALSDKSNERSETKDAFAFALIYGGGSLIKYGIFAAAVASNLIHPAAARAMQHYSSKATKMQQDSMWRRYKETGNIASAFEEL